MVTATFNSKRQAVTASANKFSTAAIEVILNNITCNLKKKTILARAGGGGGVGNYIVGMCRPNSPLFQPVYELASMFK